MKNFSLTHFATTIILIVLNMSIVEIFPLYAQESSMTVTMATVSTTIVTAATAPARIGWRILPVPGYAPETLLSLTIGGLYYFPQEGGDSNSRLNQIFGGMQYTLRNQFIVSVLPELYFNHGNVRLFGQFEVSYYPDYFYGVGNNLPESNREPFAISRAAAIGSLWFSLNGKGIKNGINAGMYFDFDYQNIKPQQADGILERMGTDSIPGRNGGLLAGLGLTLNYDSRDLTIAARTGELIEMRILPYTRLLGSNFEGWRGTLDMRKYWTFNTPTAESEGFGHTLAVQLYADAMMGDIPFFRMGLLGANIGGLALARGYYGGRFRDKFLGLVQAEYRFPIWWRFGGVVFGATGNVAATPSAFDLTTLKHSVGLGLRFALIPEERINLRIDFGYGFATKTFFPYVSFTEAF